MSDSYESVRSEGLAAEAGSKTVSRSRNIQIFSEERLLLWS